LPDFGRLRFVLDQGRGVAQDYQKAFEWSLKAAEKDSAMAQLSLGTMFWEGKGVSQDYVQAHMWCNLAASKLSGEERDVAADFRDSVAEEMTREQIAEAQKLAREWKPKGEKSGD